MKTTFAIQNLKCGGCKNTVLDGLLSVEGVQNVAMDVDESIITLTYTHEQVLENACRKLSRLGYPLTTEDNTMVKKAVSYLSCAIGKLKN